MRINQLLIAIAVLFFFAACKKEEENPVVPPPASGTADYQVVVANEGPFMSGTGTLSLINLSSGSVNQEVFQNTNSFPLGNIVQSTWLHEDHIYVVVNNASKVEVTNFPAMNSIATISGLSSPRYFVTHSNTGYISDWGTGGVHIVNLDNNSVAGEITTGSGPDRMHIHNDHLLVVNSGGFDTDNRVSVINLIQQSLSEQVTVGDNPNSVLTDADGNVRVICHGKGSWPDPEAETAGSIWILDGSTYDVIQTLTFPEASQHPSNLVANASGTVFYYLLNGNIYEMGIDDDNLPDTPLISGNFYSLTYHAGADVILASDAADFQQNGKVHVFSPQGEETATFNVGVIPGHMLPF